MKKLIMGFFASLGFIVFMGVFALGILIFSFSPPKPSIPASAVLTCQLHSDLPEHAGWADLVDGVLGSSFSLYDIVETLDYACHDPRVKGLVLRLDQAHLSLATIQELHSALRRFKKAGKFVIAHTDTFGDGHNAMGQYYMASIAHEIAMQPYGGIYLLGVGFEFFHGKKFLDKIKVGARFYKKEEYKAAFDTFTEEAITPAHREAMTALARSLYTQMVRDIAAERDMTENDLMGLMQQSPLYGAKNAMSLGLIDHVYYYDQCLKYALIKGGKESKSIPLEKYSYLRQNHKGTAEHSIALMYGVGNITRFQEGGSLPSLQGESSFNVQEFEKATEAILKDSTIKAVVLRLNTPGGEAIATETMWRQVQRLRESGRPVVVSISDYGASGGYWIATAADAIVAHPASLVGSIGVIAGKFVLHDLWEALGIQVDSVRFGEKVLMESANRDFTPGEEKCFQRMIDKTYEAFLAKVAAGRGMDTEHVKAIAKGRIWTGEDAYRLGLVDGLGDLSVAVEKAKSLAHMGTEEEVELVVFPKYHGLLEKLYSVIRPSEDLETQALHKILAVFQPLREIMTRIWEKPHIQAKMDVKLYS